MMNDEDLILYLYNDGLGAAQRQRISEALATDAALSARLSKLQAELATLDDLADPAPADPAMQQRWRSALQREARLEQQSSRGWSWTWLRWPGLNGVAAAAVLVSFGIGVGQWLDGRPDPQPQLGPSTPPLAPAAGGRSPLLRGVQLHLQDTEALLPQLSVGDPEQRRSLLAETRAQNHLYTLAAEAQNDPQLARVLRAFDGALASLASERDDPQALAADQAQLEFELAVMQTKLARAASKERQQL